MGDKKITVKEAREQRSNAVIVMFCVGIAYGAWAGWSYGKSQGRKEAYKDAEYASLISAVRTLTWEAEAKKMKEAADNGRTS